MNSLPSFIESILSEINGGVLSLLLLTLSWCIEISPIKWNPISAFLGWLGGKINKEQDQQFKTLNTKIDILFSDFEDHKIESQRSEILSFANQCMNGQKHTKEEFDHIIRVHDNYSTYIKKHHLENGQIKMAYEYIEDIYTACIRENGFL